jgi:xylulokinase
MPFLGIDVGTSGTKALILGDGQNILATAEAPHELLTPKPGWSEQHPEEWWTATQSAVRSALRRAKVNGRDIRAIGLSGQMHGSVFLDKSGNVLRPALLWNDQRTAAQCADIEQKAGGRAALLKMVSNPALTGYTAPKILWLRKHEPKKFARCAHVLLPKDYLRYRLTGDYASDVSDASGTLLLNVRTRSWHTGLMATLDLDPGLFPRLVESPDITGQLTAQAATALGLATGTPVVGGAGDQAAGAVGTGTVIAGLVSVALGTSGVVFTSTDQPVDDLEGRMQTMCHAAPNLWCVFGCMLSAGGAWQYLRNTLFPEQVAKAKDPGSVYAAMMASAARAPVGSENLLFLPYLTGERCPHADPNARGAFVGLTPRHSRDHLLRAGLEGINFGLREQMVILRGMGLRMNEIRAQGGGARSAFWRQMMADMFAAPVNTIAVSEGAALGAALLAAVGVKHFADVASACRATIRVAETVRPRAPVVKQYAALADRYAVLYQTLKPFFATDVTPHG